MTAKQAGLLEKARDSLRAAKLLEAAQLFDFAAARAYYTMFYVAQLFLLERGLSFSKHKSLLAAFGQHFVKTGIIPAHFHRYLIDAQEKRLTGDYHATVHVP